jgi:hypothetical protein
MYARRRITFRDGRVVEDVPLTATRSAHNEMAMRAEARHVAEEDSRNGAHPHQEDVASARKAAP